MISKNLFSLIFNFFIKIIVKGKKNKIIPVGFVRKIKPSEIPESTAYLILLLFSKFHFVKNNKLNELNAVRDKSIK